MSDNNGNFWSALISAGGNLVGQGISYSQQRKLNKQQYDLQIRGLKESPNAMRKGLESAGYNPILALGNTNAYAKGGVGGSPTPSTLGSEAVNAYQQNKAVNANVEATNAETNLKNEQALTEQAKREQMRFQNAMTDVETHLKQKDLSSYERRLYTQLYEQMQNAENLRAMASLQGYNAQTQRISANAQKLQAETSSKWTPVGIGAGVAAGIGGYVLGKVPGLKYLKKKKVGF